MRYALLICADESARAALSPEEAATARAAWDVFTADLVARGVFQSAERLRPTTDATTVRVVDGDVVVSDGPFAETKEQMGGFYLIDCKDLDEAIEIASKVPAAAHGTVEVRPIWDA